MKPKFKNMMAWEQAQILMQPIYIRIIDNLRKQLDRSVWKADYQEIQSPYPGHQLLLTYKNRSLTVDIWQLCFQVCFVDYPVSWESQQPSPTKTPTPEIEVDIDTRLIDDTGVVDWQQLETKTQHLINTLFANLPAT